MKLNVHFLYYYYNFRYQEKGVTKIREEDYGANAKTCQIVLGMDCSSMFLAIIYGEQPVGEYKLYLVVTCHGQSLLYHIYFLNMKF